MRFTNDVHPELVIADLGVRFRGGEVEVDIKTAAALRKLPPELGVTVVKDQTNKKAPNRRGED